MEYRLPKTEACSLIVISCQKRTSLGRKNSFDFYIVACYHIITLKYWRISYESEIDNAGRNARSFV